VGTGKAKATLKGHEQSVMAVAFSRDGKQVASGANDGTVRLWEAATGKEAAVLKHPAFVQAVAFSPDGKSLAAGSIDGVIKLWSVAGK
jgi:WD40 repeat protein